jgi:uncharacterized membrane protein
VNRFFRLRALAGWALVATLVAGAGTQHNHSLLTELLESTAAESSPDQFLKTHQDGASSPLHWDRVLRVGGEPCVACHSQRCREVTPFTEAGLVFDAPGGIVPTAPLAAVSVSRLPDSCRAPPTVL